MWQGYDNEGCMPGDREILAMASGNNRFLADAHPDSDYLEFDPFSEDRDVTIECRKVSIVTVRKEQPCAASWLLDGYHPIAPGTKAKKETAKVDGQFGSCYCCLPCLDRLIALNHPD